MAEQDGMFGQGLTQRPCRESHSPRARQGTVPFVQIRLLVLLVATAASAQWLEKTIYLPDEFGGLIWPNCVAFDTVRNKVYIGGGTESPWDGRGADEDYEVWVVVVDAVSLRRIARIRVPDGVVGLGLNPVSGKLYCSTPGFNSSRVCVIDCTRDSLVATIVVGSMADSLYVNSDANKVYATCAREVAVIDGSADTILTTIPIPNGPLQLTCASASHTIYCREATKITLIDTRGDSIRGVLELGPEPYGTRGACWNPLENKYYCLKDTGESFIRVLTVADGLGDSVLTQMLMPAGGICFNPADNRVYCIGVDSMYVIDCSADTVETLIPIPGEEYPVSQIICSPRSSRLYCVPEPSGDNWRGVMVVDCAGDSFVEILPTGVMPSTMGNDPKQNRLYTINYETDDATVIDCTGDSVLTTVCLGSKAEHLVYASNEDKVYCGGKSFEGILAIDAATNRVVAEIPTGTLVTDVCYNPVLSKLYSVYGAADTVVVIDCRTDRVVARINVGDRPMYLAFSPVGGSKVYCSNSNSTYVSVIDCVQDSVIAQVNVGGTTLDLLMNTREDKLYCNALWQTVAVIDCHTDRVIHRSDVGGRCAVYNPVENKAYVGRGCLHVVDGHSDSAIATIDTLDTYYWQPGCYNSRNHKTYVPVSTFPGPKALLVLDGITDSLLAVIWEPAGGAGMNKPLYSPVNNKLHIPFNDDGFVGVFDGATDSLLTKVTVGSHPRGTTWSPVSNRTYVACYYGSCVSVIQDSLIPGIEESPRPRASSDMPVATIVSGVLQVSTQPTAGGSWREVGLYDANGRKVLQLAAGANDVHCLPTGVYFVRNEPIAESRGPSAPNVRKVVVTR